MSKDAAVAVSCRRKLIKVKKNFQVDGFQTFRLLSIFIPIGEKTKSYEENL